MKILLVNDDGYQAAGIGVLAKVLSTRHEVYIAAPDRQRSAVSRAMTLTEPLRAERAQQPLCPGVPCYAVSGYPVDCFRLALGNLFPRPDAVISGINHGPNLGSDTVYSGTVAAAEEAAFEGIPALAVSDLEERDLKHLDTAAELSLRIIERLYEHPLPFGSFLNLNVPDLPMECLKGIRRAPIAFIGYEMAFREIILPDGKTGYLAPAGARITDNSALDVDERWCKEGWATVTELTYDMRDIKSYGSFDLTGLL